MSDAERGDADDEPEQAVTEEHALPPVVLDVARVALDDVGVLALP